MFHVIYIAKVASAVVDCKSLSDRLYVCCLLTYLQLQGQHAWCFEHAPSRAENVTDLRTGSVRLRFEHVTPGLGLLFCL